MTISEQSLSKQPLLGQTLTDQRRPIMVIAGEHSGDNLAADLIFSLRRRGYRHFFGTGGERMEAAGVELFMRLEEMASMGFTDVLFLYRRLKRLSRRLSAEAKKVQAAAVILVDYPGFNLYMASLLKEQGLKVIYLVSPQLWAWNYRRIHKIEANVDLMLPLFAFEQQLYNSVGVTAHCIGHPLIHSIPQRLLQQERLVLSSATEITIALMPGSRRSELLALLPKMLRAARLVQQRYPKARFLIPVADKGLESLVKKKLQRYPQLNLQYFVGRSLRVMEASDILVLASGTVTLEAAYFTKPMILLYRVSWLNLLIAIIFLRVRFIGMVNLLARRQAALELLQTEVTAANICDEICRLKEDGRYRRSLVEELHYVRQQLGEGKPALKAAQLIHKLLSQPPPQADGAPIPQWDSKSLTSQLTSQTLARSASTTQLNSAARQGAVPQEDIPQKDIPKEGILKEGIPKKGVSRKGISKKGIFKRLQAATKFSQPFLRIQERTVSTPVEKGPSRRERSGRKRTSGKEPQIQDK